MIYVKRRRPPMEAVQYNGENEKEILDFCEYTALRDEVLFYGECKVYIGDYIVKEHDDYFVHYTESQFNKLFEIFYKTQEETEND